MVDREFRLKSIKRSLVNGKLLTLKEVSITCSRGEIK